jgi:hypothetical protein
VVAGRYTVEAMYVPDGRVQQQTIETAAGKTPTVRFVFR